MPISTLFQLICIVTGILLVRSQDDQLTVSTEPPIGSCEPITGVAMCLNINWKNASFPNLREHATQIDANLELVGYEPLVQQLCSNAVVHFLCSVYVPFCSSSDGFFGGRPITLKPCREVCEYVRRDCEPILERNSFRWPSHLDCDNFPSSADIDGSIESLCFNINVTDVCIPMGISDGIDDALAIAGGGCYKPPTPSSNISTTITPTTSSTRVNTLAATTTSTRLPSETSSVAPPVVQPPRICPRMMRLSGHALSNSSYVFADINNCAVRCEGTHFTEDERNIVAPVFILICAILCIGFTLFTVGTFLIDRQRYHYPERPVIFLALCYLALSFAFIVGSIVKLRDPNGSFACSDTSDDTSFIFQRLPNASPTYRSASCVILFIFIYYFQMAAAIWWVVLTLTWFMASTLKWGEEAVERPWILYHVLAWCLPALQVILILALQLVDGDQLSGTCFTGNHHHVGLGVFVILPLIAYLILGIVFLLIGFLSLVLILQQISKDPYKSRRLTRLIIRILIYGILYVIPNIIYICLCIYEVAERTAWEKSYVDCQADPLCSTPESTPQFAALLIRYVMLFVIGIFSTFWVISWKTLVAWRKFFSSIFFCHHEQMYDLPTKKETAI